MVMFSLNSFGGEIPDSLTMTREFLKEGNYKKAYHTIGQYFHDHPGDFNATWLYAYTSYYARHFSKSMHLYEEATGISPGNYYLKLDYARTLVNIGDYNKALPLLRTYLDFEPKNTTALLNLANLRYRQADYRKALSTLDKISINADDYGYVAPMLKEIELAKAPWISMGMGYTSDDQPMQGYFPEIKAGWSLHPLATVSLDLRSPVFRKNGQTFYGLWGEAGNKFYFARPSLSLDISLGVLKFPGRNTFTMTGSVKLTKTFIRNLEIKLLGERVPYFSTTSSIDSSVIEHHAALSIGWKDMNSWNGSMTAEARRYPIDSNTVISLNGWVMSPPARFSVFELRFGLGYSYCTSGENNFVPEKSLAAILQDYDPDAGIKGIYNPYFTPKKQNVGSVIIAVSIHPGKLFDINLNANLGVYSIVMVPFLYLDKNSSEDIFINKGFVSENYFPATADLSVGFKPAWNIRLQADYHFSSTYYYINNYAGLTLKINLTHAKGK